MFSVIFLSFLLLVTLIEWVTLCTTEFLKAPIFININLADFENIQITDLDTVQETAVANVIEQTNAPAQASTSISWMSFISRHKLLICATLAILAYAAYKIRVWTKADKTAKKDEKNNN